MNRGDIHSEFPTLEDIVKGLKIEVLQTAGAIRLLFLLYYGTQNVSALIVEGNIPSHTLMKCRHLLGEQGLGLICEHKMGKSVHLELTEVGKHFTESLACLEVFAGNMQF